MTSVHAVFFDVDDTLIDYEAAALAAFRGALGPDAPYEEWLRLPHFSRWTSGELGFQEMRDLRMADFLAQLGRDDEVGDAARLEALRFDALIGGCALYDDVLPCVSALRARGLKLGLITNNEPTHQRAKLAAVGLDGVFDAVVISGELGVAKPEPEIFAHACAKLDVEPAAALHVGDNRIADVAGAIGAGLRGVWLDRGGVGGDVHPAASVVRSLTEVPALVA